jgi:hypothetical protein
MAKALTMDEKMQRATERLVRSDVERPGSAERKRNVFNGTEGKLTIQHTIPGFHLHIFNDAPGRIQQALDGGYVFVTPDEIGSVKDNVVSRNTDIGDKVRFLVGRSDDNQPLYAYLMKIKQEWYEEDQNIMQDKNNLVDDAIRSGANAKDGKAFEGSYIPKEGIKYKN